MSQSSASGISGMYYSFRQRIKAYYRRKFPQVIVLLLSSLLFIIFFAPRIFIVIKPGEEGVLFRILTGTDLRNVYAEGLHIIFPTNTLYHYNVRIQQVTRTFEILTKDGLHVKIQCSIRYRVKPGKTLPYLHVRIGPKYLETVIIPEFSAAIRNILGKYRPDELYALDRKVVQQEILNLAILEIKDKNIIIDDFLLMDIELPAVLGEAIVRKLVQEQAALEYHYKVQAEKEEAKRKRVEALGIKDFQSIVSQGISPSYLKWRGIEATLELAKSNNAKVVLVGGGGSGGLPLILNLDSAVSPSALSEQKTTQKTPALKEERRLSLKAPEFSPLTAKKAGIPTPQKAKGLALNAEKSDHTPATKP